MKHAKDGQEGDPSGSSLVTGIVADDLTGGMLVASSLVEQGIPCPFVTQPAAVHAHSDAPAIVVAGRFRLAPAEAAVEWFDQAQNALSKAGARHLLYKYCATFDSTDAGNIGPCADALMQHVGADRLGFCTAFPERGVTIYQGHIFLREQLLCNSDKRFDPITPMQDPDLVGVLQRQTANKVALVPQQIVAQGRAETRRFIEDAHRNGEIYFFFDAIDDDAIAVCAEVTRSWPAMTGGDSLLASLPSRQISMRRPIAKAPPLAAGHTAIIAGSCAIATLGQLESFRAKYPVQRIALDEAAQDFDAVVSAAMEWCSTRLPNGPVALAISDEPAGVVRTQAQLGVEKARVLGERLCAELARRLQSVGVNRFIVAGGETSGVVSAALGVSAMGVYPHPAVPGGLCVDEPHHRLCCYFKAGKMGHKTILTDLVEILREWFDGR